MTELGLRSGTKLDLDCNGQILKSTFFQEMNDGSCLVSVPIESGDALALTSGTELTVGYMVGGQVFRAAGSVLGVVEQGVRIYLKLRLSALPNGAERRTQVRVAVELPLTLTSGKRSDEGALPSQTVDLSSGGAAVLTNASAGIGEVIRVTFQVDGLDSKPFRAEICWMRAAPSESQFSTALGVRFLLEEPLDAELLEQLMQAKA